MGLGLGTDSCNSLLFPLPQVYEGLKPSDKYEKPLDYRYGMRLNDLLRCARTHPHTVSGTPHHYFAVALLLAGVCVDEWSRALAQHDDRGLPPFTGGPCAMTSGGSVNSLQKALLTKVRP